MEFDFQSERQKRSAMAELDVMGVEYRDKGRSLDVEEEYIGVEPLDTVSA